jgi:hypothetical protein
MLALGTRTFDLPEVFQDGTIAPALDDLLKPGQQAGQVTIITAVGQATSSASDLFWPKITVATASGTQGNLYLVKTSYHSLTQSERSFHAMGALY